MEDVGTLIVSLLSSMCDEEFRKKAEEAVRGWSPILKQVFDSAHDCGTERRIKRYKAYLEAGMDKDSAIYLLVEETRMMGRFAKNGS